MSGLCLFCTPTGSRQKTGEANITGLILTQEKTVIEKVRQSMRDDYSYYTSAKLIKIDKDVMTFQILCFK